MKQRGRPERPLALAARLADCAGETAEVVWMAAKGLKPAGHRVAPPPS